MSERLFGEIALDPEYFDKYMIVKAIKIANQLKGVVLFFEKNGDEAFAEFNRVVQEDPNGVYHLFPPTDNVENRKSLTKGGGI